MRTTLVILMLVLCFGAAAPMANAQTDAPIVQQAQTPVKKGFFAFLQGDPAAQEARKLAREERRAARAQARLDRQSARAAKSSGAGEVVGRADVAQAVQVAIDNKPKGRWWCVPFARMVAGLDIRGNAKTWWDQAKDRYARGHEPQVGAVISFAASRSMPKGHVAVVSKVVSDREILIVHANWVRGKVTLDDRAIDVSQHGDWSAVRVENSAGTPGRVNPVNGFIYQGKSNG